VDPNKLTLQTVRYDPCEHFTQLEGAHGAFTRSKWASVAPGIRGIPFGIIDEPNVMDVPGNPAMTNQQWEAWGYKFGLSQVAFAYLTELIAAGLVTINAQALQPGWVAPANPAYGPAHNACRALSTLIGLWDTEHMDPPAPSVLDKCLDRCFLSAISDVATRKAAELEFVQSQPNAFVNRDRSKLAPIPIENNRENPIVAYDRLMWEGVSLAVNAFNGSGHAKRATVGGRAINNAAPGDSFDVLVGLGRIGC
jgi:hypothetical protein